MEKIRSVKFNFVMNSILTASSILFPMITYPYVSRVLGASGTGAVDFVTSNVTFFSMFAQLGIPTYGIRACARVRDSREEFTRTVQEILLINLVTMVISYILLFLCIAAIPRYRSEKTLFLIMSSLLFFNTIGVEWLYKGLEQYRYITVRSLIFKGIALAAVFLLVRSKEDYVIYGAISIFALVGSGILNFINLRKYVDLKPTGHYQLRKHLRPVSFFFAMSVATTIYTNMDSSMLGFLCTKTDSGYYGAAVKIKNLLVSFVTSLGTVLLPRMSYYVEKGEKELFLETIRKAFHFILLVSLPLCLYFMIFSGPVILLMNGSDYYPASAQAMTVIMPTLVLIGITNIIGIQMMIPRGQEKLVLYSEIAGAIVNVVINLLLIPVWKASGAAAGTVAAETAVLAVQLAFCRKELLPLLKKLPWKKTGYALFAGTAVCLPVCFPELPAFIELAVSAFLFFGAYGIVLLLCREELTLELIHKIKKIRQ